MKTLRFHMIPISRAKKVPLTTHGEKDASNSISKGAEWFSRYPNCNWAIATGPSDLIAIDEDCYKPIYVEGALERACNVASFPDTAEIRSARGGRVRLYLRGGANIPSRNSVLPAIDIRANTGYVLCPPSRNAQGQTYTWVRKGPIVDAPPALVAFLQDKARAAGLRGSNKPRRSSGLGEEVFLKAGDGRWEFLRRLGGLLRREGVGVVAMYDALMSFVANQCEYDHTVCSDEVKRLCQWLATQPIGGRAQMLNEELVEKDGKFYIEECE